MFAGRYFAPRYFAPRYFATGATNANPGYFPHGYFARRYYADRYFPGADAAGRVKPSYFFHGFFPARYFPDRYFPGEFVEVQPPAPPISTGGGISPPFELGRPIIHATGRLRLPALVLKGRGVLLPAGVEVLPARALLLDLELQAALLATASPADAGILRAVLALPASEVESLVVTFTKQNAVRFSDDDELEAFYRETLELLKDRES